MQGVENTNNFILQVFENIDFITFYLPCWTRQLHTVFEHRLLHRGMRHPGEAKQLEPEGDPVHCQPS